MVLRFFPQKQKYTPEAAQFVFDPEGAVPKHIATISEIKFKLSPDRAD